MGKSRFACGDSSKVTFFSCPSTTWNKKDQKTSSLDFFLQMPNTWAFANPKEFYLLTFEQKKEEKQIIKMKDKPLSTPAVHKLQKKLKF